MTYHEKVEYLAGQLDYIKKLSTRYGDLIKEYETELSELRILLQVERDLASKEYPTVDPGPNVIGEQNDD